MDNIPMANPRANDQGLGCTLGVMDGRADNTVETWVSLGKTLRRIE